MLDANDVDDPTLEIPDSEKGGFQRHFGTWAPGARRAACWAGPLLGGAGILRLASFFGKPRKTNSFGLTPEQQAELENFRKKAAEARLALKQLRKNLRVETDALEFWTKVVNIALVPLLVALAGLVLALGRRRREAAAA